MNAPLSHSDLPGSSLGARLRNLHRQIRLILGLRRTHTIDGVRYVERTHEPLRRAISRKGRGYKDYEVTFRSGERMRIRFTPDRVYADLVGGSALSFYRPADEHIRPGMRLLVLDAGTGFGPAWLASRVGPSGAIVALEEDGESAHFAPRRYTLNNVAFERAGTDALGGELDGSFDGVLAHTVLADNARRADRLTELWRVLKPGGWIIPGGPAAGESIEAILADASIPAAQIADSAILTRGPEGVTTFLVRKRLPPAQLDDNQPPDHHGPGSPPAEGGRGDTGR